MRLLILQSLLTVVSSLAVLSPIVLTAAEETANAKPSAHTTTWKPTKIIGSKHDLTKLNQRAGLEAMSGMAFSDYGNPCIYCHVPPEIDGVKDKPGQIPGWNRVKGVGNYKYYSSTTFDSKQEKPGAISMLCLSCHDGSMAVDRIVTKPRLWSSEEEATLHMKMSDSDDLASCGKCHDGKVAHNINAAVIGKDLSDDHPVAIRYSGLDLDIKGFKSPDGPGGFENGIRLFNGNIECATCHDIHNPDARMLLRVDQEVLCSTCHIN